MKNLQLITLAATASVLMLAACTESPVANAAKTNTAAKADAAAPAHPSDPVESALAAAPASIANGAKVIAMGADKSMKVLREGKNGWTCMPDTMTTPGPDPMCMDANAAKWVMAWMGHKPPPADAVGMMYMLEGGTDASNTDPYATAPTADNDWVKTGPHVMVVGSADVLKGYPSGAKPDTKVPYVMWAGTPYAHLMVPVG